MSLPTSGLAQFWLSGTATAETIYGTIRNDQLSGNGGTDTLRGGAGDDTYIVFDASDVIVELPGEGTDSVRTWGGGYELPRAVENLYLLGGGNSFGTGNAGDNIIVGNAGRNVIDGRGGDDRLAGGGGDDLFIVAKGIGTTRIADFAAGGAAGDTVRLDGFALRSIDEIEARMVQVGGDTWLNLGDGQTIVFEGVPAARFAAADFRIPFVSDSLHRTFTDNFDSLSLDTAATEGTWKTAYYTGLHTLSQHNELQYYLDPHEAGSGSRALGVNPFSIADGVLTIRAAPAAPSIRPYIDDLPYTSGMITTETSFAQTYGYFEMRAQLPAGQGLWPAFWLLPADRTWPPEIDIMEMIGSVPTVLNTTAIAPGAIHNRSVTVADMTAGFHTYGLDWTAQKIAWYFDGQKVFEIDTPASMHKPMYMLANLAVGGDWPGAPDATTAFPAEYRIDYIRAWSHAPSSLQPATVTFSNAMDLKAHGDSFTVRPEAGADATYTASDLDIRGLDGRANVSVSAAADGDLSIVANSAWNTIKNVTVAGAGDRSIGVANFVGVDVRLGDGDGVVNVSGVKRGSIATGDGDDTVTVSGFANDRSGNLLTIGTGDGDDIVSYAGNAMNAVKVSTGDGRDLVNVAGGTATVSGGDGDDTIIVGMASAALSGGGGGDTFVFAPGARATIADFAAGTDAIELAGVDADAVRVGIVGGSTRIDFTDGSVTLVGIALAADALDLHIG
ncbi:MAG: family 16 glycosylhydrolase [Rhodospirillales bacterium]